MRIAMTMSYAGGFEEAIEDVVALEAVGLDRVWVAEAYGYDAVSTMGFLAARTERVEIASGILPIYTRTPTLLAMTAAGIDALSGGRCVLGLGASGPQVIEGFHGITYDAPLGRTREIVDVCRQVWRRERVEHDGRHYQMPLPEGQGTGLGKPLKMITHPVRERIPIVVAALGDKNVQMTAEVAEGWLPIFFWPEKAKDVWGDVLDAGLAKRDPELGELDIIAGGMLAIGDGVEGLRDFGRPMAALYVGGMGAKGRNFYNSLFSRYGYGDEAERIQELYLSGQKDEAAGLLPDEFLASTSLIGSEGFVKERLAAYQEAGVTTLNIAPMAQSRTERVEQVAKLRSLVDAL
ncbi:MAG: LLM class F420-dependent oxidoreductase [Actinomycetota bacterium]